MIQPTNSGELDDTLRSAPVSVSEAVNHEQSNPIPLACMYCKQGEIKNRMFGLMPQVTRKYAVLCGSELDYFIDLHDHCIAEYLEENPHLAISRVL